MLRRRLVRSEQSNDLVWRIRWGLKYQGRQGKSTYQEDTNYKTVALTEKSWSYTTSYLGHIAQS